ncbi:MAG: diaminopimelate epimerase [Brumimicrobium sp.]|nr:diaminopimelate epimerase [Brumimicrobium sp.]
MILKFQKYQGTGNDFIMLDATEEKNLKFSKKLIQQLCDRRFGIGADGLILIRKSDKTDFEMDYFNADGSQSFCGNGARCAVRFAESLNLCGSETTFEAIDGIHSAHIDGTTVALRMNDVESFKQENSHYEIYTGSPHYIKFVANLAQENIVEFGRKIRYSQAYKKEGINVNLVQIADKQALTMLTYERGVEDETYSCGTGATAAALAYALKGGLNGKFRISIGVKGGQLVVSANRTKNTFREIYLSGPAEAVYHGEISV